MTWTPEQWEAFSALVEEGWPGKFEQSAADAWRVMLDEMEPRHAIETLRQLLLQGHRFRPSLSEFLGAARQDASAPTWDEAYQLVYRCAARQTVGEDLHPLVASFIERQGLGRLGQLPLDDPDWGEKTRRDLGEAWDRHVEAFDGRQVAELASSGLKRLTPIEAPSRPELAA